MWMYVGTGVRLTTDVYMYSFRSQQGEMWMAALSTEKSETKDCDVIFSRGSLIDLVFCSRGSLEYMGRTHAVIGGLTQD